MAAGGIALLCGIATAGVGVLPGDIGANDGQRRGVRPAADAGQTEDAAVRDGKRAGSSPFSGAGGVGTPSLEFERFRAAVQFLNDRAQQAGSAYFVRIEHLGYGVVQVTASDAWLAAPAEERQDTLDTLYRLWRAADGSGFPVVVRIVDKQGTLVAEKTRL